MKSNLKLGGRPKLACEISPDRVLAGRISDHRTELANYSARELASGTVVPDLIENNLRHRSSVASRIRETLGEVSGRTRDVIAIVPDAAVRVLLLDVDALPGNREEADSVVRFRLKKSLPFDVEKAKLSYHVQTSGAGLRLVAAVALASVVEDYEAAFHEAGYEPGVVLPSTLAALGAADATRPTLVVKVDARTTSIAILDSGQLLLFRTLENARGSTITGEQLAEEVYPSIVFFQDTYQLNLERIAVAGVPESSGAAQALGAQTGAQVQELISESKLGSAAGDSVPRYRMAGVVGALMS
jgi:type IV pilus assembly protein PilM